MSTASGLLYQSVVSQSSKPSPVVCSAVPHSDVYKVLREAELQAIRSLVRVFAMRNGAAASNSDAPEETKSGGSDVLTRKHQARILEDLCDAFDVSQAALEVEQQLAASDPAVQAVAGAKETVAALRRAHHDAFNDISLGAWLAVDVNTEDDHGEFYRQAVGAASTGRSTISAPAGGRRAAAPAARSNTSALRQEYTKLNADVDRIIRELAKPGADVAAREALKQKLEGKVTELMALRERVEADETMEGSGASTPR